MFILEDEILLLCPAYMIGEKKTTLGKTYGTKVWHYWENIGEHNENLVNYWELDEHTLGVGKTKVNPSLVVLIKFTLKKFQKKFKFLQ